MTSRARIIEVAEAEIGSPGHLRIMEYHRDAIGRSVGDKELEWCGLFCLWAIHRAGLALGVHWRLGGGFCEEQRLTRVRLPAPGDVAYYASPFHHHALVKSVDLDAGTFESIDGNQAGDTVQHRKGIKLTKPTCFYSISKLLGPEHDTDPAPPPPTLRLGAEGADVVTLQQILNRYQNAGLVTDGKMGPKTVRALQVFQRDQELDADGVCGPKTWGALLRV